MRNFSIKNFIAIAALLVAFILSCKQTNNVRNPSNRFPRNNVSSPSLPSPPPGDINSSIVAPIDITKVPPLTAMDNIFVKGKIDLGLVHPGVGISKEKTVSVSTLFNISPFSAILDDGNGVYRYRISYEIFSEGFKGSIQKEDIGNEGFLFNIILNQESCGSFPVPGRIDTLTKTFGAFDLTRWGAPVVPGPLSPTVYSLFSPEPSDFLDCKITIGAEIPSNIWSNLLDHSRNNIVSFDPFGPKTAFDIGLPLLGLGGVEHSTWSDVPIWNANYPNESSRKVEATLRIRVERFLVDPTPFTNDFFVDPTINIPPFHKFYTFDVPVEFIIAKSANATPDFLGPFPLPSPIMGGSVATGDINGDGVSDFVLGAVKGTGPSFLQIYLGAPNKRIQGYKLRPEDLGKPSLRIEGPNLIDYDFMNATTGSFFAQTIRLEDLNRDGRADLLVAAPFVSAPDEAGSNAGSGSIYLFYSETIMSCIDGVIGPFVGETRVCDYTDADVKFYLNDLGISSRLPPFLDPVDSFNPGVAYGVDIAFGRSFDVGDINQDGIKDIVVGAPNANAGEGIVIVFLGGNFFSSEYPHGCIFCNASNPGPSVFGTIATVILPTFFQPSVLPEPPTPSYDKELFGLDVKLGHFSSDLCEDMIITSLVQDQDLVDNFETPIVYLFPCKNLSPAYLDFQESYTSFIRITDFWREEDPLLFSSDAELFFDPKGIIDPIFIQNPSGENLFALGMKKATDDFNAVPGRVIIYKESNFPDDLAADCDDDPSTFRDSECDVTYNKFWDVNPGSVNVIAKDPDIHGDSFGHSLSVAKRPDGAEGLSLVVTDPFFPPSLADGSAYLYNLDPTTGLFDQSFEAAILGKFDERLGISSASALDTNTLFFGADLKLEPSTLPHGGAYALSTKITSDQRPDGAPLFGTALAARNNCDFDGDGIADLILSDFGDSPLADPDVSASKHLVFLGKDGGSVLDSDPITLNKAKATGIVFNNPYFYKNLFRKAFKYFIGQEAHAITGIETATVGPLINFFMQSIEVLGDINGDGYCDVAVGFPSGGLNVLNSNEGYVNLYFGGKRFRQQFNILANVTIENDSGLDSSSINFGYKVSGMGDVNQDGYDDFAITDIDLSANAGRVRVFLGRGTWSFNMKATDADEVINDFGLPPSTLFGVSIHGGGDFNGDGYSDFLISKTTNPPNTGSELNIYFGGQPFNVVADIKIDGSSAISLPLAFFGKQAKFVGDINGDGFDDIAISNASIFPNFPHPGTVPVGFNGEVYVFFGQKNPPALIDAISANDLIITGTDDENLGYTIADNVDFNGDGYKDIILAAPGFDSPFQDPIDPLNPFQLLSGAIKVYLGGENPDAIVDTTIVGRGGFCEFGGLGLSLSGADFNNDGFSDIVASDIGIAKVYSIDGNAGKVPFLYVGDPRCFGGSCGNGVRNVGEECDDGTLNGACHLGQCPDLTFCAVDTDCGGGLPCSTGAFCKADCTLATPGHCSGNANAKCLNDGECDLFDLGTCIQTCGP